MLSNFVSLTSETTQQKKTIHFISLWIAFKFCIFDIRNNVVLALGINHGVVNCFQILYLWHQKQRIITALPVYPRCELLSNFVSLTSETTARVMLNFRIPLWIAFKFCIFDIRNNDATGFKDTKQVVNCFQILYLWHQKQLVKILRYLRISCELLSNFVSLTSETTDAKTNEKVRSCELLSNFVSLTSETTW